MNITYGFQSFFHASLNLFLPQEENNLIFNFIFEFAMCPKMCHKVFIVHWYCYRSVLTHSSSVGTMILGKSSFTVHIKLHTRMYSLFNYYENIHILVYFLIIPFHSTKVSEVKTVPTTISQITHFVKKKKNVEQKFESQYKLQSLDYFYDFTTLFS